MVSKDGDESCEKKIIIMGGNTERTLSVNVLISCMHQKDTSIIERTGIQTDVIVVKK